MRWRRQLGWFVPKKREAGLSPRNGLVCAMDARAVRPGTAGESGSGTTASYSTGETWEKTLTGGVDPSVTRAGPCKAVGEREVELVGWTEMGGNVTSWPRGDLGPAEVRQANRPVEGEERVFHSFFFYYYFMKLPKPI